MKNRLQLETSPYLRQHDENPVDWYPWGPEALEKAKRENKPILLSVGYSACHWCHVMAHESFENPAIAALMNEHFVNVKVDREERPDLDQIYQNVAQAMTQGGGWPLTVFLLPDQRPFFGGTYFPPEDRWGRPGFPRVLRSLADAYRADFASVEGNARRLKEIIGELERNERSMRMSSPGVPDAGGRKFPFLRGIAEEMLSTIDWNHGGFGGAPKFPNTMMLSFLWRIGNDSRASSDFRERASAAVILTLSKMARGGIFDQIGGGFSRYSVDDRWAVPHFEKMLYDNGLLLQIYGEVLSLDRLKSVISPEARALFHRTIEKTVTYLLREMEDPNGGFYAAQDADSDGEEGKFFVWDRKDLAAILSPSETRVFSLRYGVDEMGNFEHGKTVLFQDLELREIAARAGLAEEEARRLLESAEAKVFAEREKRVRPGLDDKILVGWNGLLISGLLWAAHALGETELAAHAKKAAVRAFRRLATGTSLSASIQKGEAKGNAFLDDYAFLSRAAIDLVRFSGDPALVEEALDAAESWTGRIFDHFADRSGDPGFFFTADDHEALLQRPKSLYDQAIPSGTSVALGVALVGAEIESHLERKSKFTAYAKAAREQLERLEPALGSNPYGYGELASAVLFAEAGLRAFSGSDAGRAIASDRDFVFGVSKLFPSKPDRFQVCEKGVCREFSKREEYFQ